jgi:hypothetical protein
MTIMTIHIPDDVKEAFDEAFGGEDKDAIIAQLIRTAAEAEERAATEAEDKTRRRREAADAILELRKTMLQISQEEIRNIREELRK